MKTQNSVEYKNRKAYYEYEILETFEAGIKLEGQEVKSVRLGSANINDCYVVFKKGKPFLLNMFIEKFANAYSFGKYDTRRSRELLLHKNEILKIQQKIKEKSLTVVCTKGYFVGSLFKVEIALARGKNIHDKRETIKQRDLSREREKY